MDLHSPKPLSSHPRRGIDLTMKPLFQARRNRSVSVPPETRILIIHPTPSLNGDTFERKVQDLTPLRPFCDLFSSVHIVPSRNKATLANMGHQTFG